MTFIVEEHPPLEALVGAVVAVEGLVVGLAVAGLVVGPAVAGLLVGLVVAPGLVVAALVGLDVAAFLVGAAVAAGLVVAALVGLVVAEGLVVAAAFVGAAVGFTGAVVDEEPELYDTPVLTTPTEREAIALSIVTCFPFVDVRRTDTGKLIFSLVLSV